MLVPYKSESLLKSFFDDFFTPYESYSTTYSNSYLKELDDKYELAIEMPGLSKDDLSIEVSNGILTISGSRKKDEGKYVFNYMKFGDFTYKYSLPKNTGEVSAEMKDGLLILTIEKIDNSKKILIK